MDDDTSADYAALQGWMAVATASSRQEPTGVVCAGYGLGTAADDSTGYYGVSISSRLCEESLRRAATHFEAAFAFACASSAARETTSGPAVYARHPDAALGLARVYSARGDAHLASGLLRELMEALSDMWPARVELCEVLLRCGDVTGAEECLQSFAATARARVADAVAFAASVPRSHAGTQRAPHVQNFVIPVLRTALFLAQVRSGPSSHAAAAAGSSLAAAIATAEPTAHRLAYEVARSSGRTALHAPLALAASISIAETAAAAAPRVAAYIAEVAALRLQAGDIAGATAAARDAARLDDGSCVSAVVAAVSLRLAHGQLDDAAAQLEMLR